jgi:hypothetical protein
MKTNYFKDCVDLKAVKRRYKELALLHHPDRGGSTQTMQEINNQYATIIKEPFYKFETQTETEKDDYFIYPELIDQIIKLNGIIIELIGDWLWLSGNTYPHKQTLKDLGFYFAPKKTMWYYRPAEYKAHKGKPQPIENIRIKYGSSIISKNPSTFQLIK